MTQAAEQKKRNDNITMRRNEKKNDKKGSSKKATGRPGFEGRVYGNGKTKSNNKGKWSFIIIYRRLCSLLVIISTAFVGIHNLSISQILGLFSGSSQATEQ